MNNQTNNPDDVLNGFNPFEQREPAVPRATSSVPRPTFNAAILPEAPKPNVSQNQNIYREIEQRERDLNDLENKINQREYELNKNQDSKKFEKMNNFPPMPSWFPCKPCFYQDFNVEIPEEYRFNVKLGFYIWLAYTILLFINVFGTLTYMVVLKVGTDSGTMFGVALLMFFLMPILGYLLWFRPLYRAFRSQSSINFFVFFLFFAILIIVIIIQVLGINVLGSCGWINSSTIVGSNIGVGIFMFIIAIGFSAVLAVSVYLYIKVHRTYRTTGASFSKAKQEMRNETVTAALHA